MNGYYRTAGMKGPGKRPVYIPSNNHETFQDSTTSKATGPTQNRPIGPSSHTTAGKPSVTSCLYPNLGLHSEKPRGWFHQNDI